MKTNKIILVENNDGNLYWLPENYAEFNVGITAGIPEPLYNITTAKVNKAATKVNAAIKQIALSRNAVPNIRSVESMLVRELKTVLK